MLTMEERPLKERSTVNLSTNNFGNLSKGVKKSTLEELVSSKHL